MDELLSSLTAWLETHEGPLAYLALMLAAMIEYVIPPLPGDSITLLGVSLATSAGWSLWAVYLSLNAGAIAGGQIAYFAGRYFGPRHRRPAFLRGKRAEAELERVIALFRERGAIALALNRFVPAFRSVFFVGAGVAGLPALSVLGWGALSALLWNALLLGVGYLIGASFTVLESGMRIYAAVALAAILTGVGIAMWRRRKRPGASAVTNENAPEAGAPSASSSQSTEADQQ